MENLEFVSVNFSMYYNFLLSDCCAIDDLLTNVMSSRAKLGATHNRLTHAIDSMTTRAIETRASRSQILDTDYAVTTSSLAKAKILNQASTAMLAQANSAPGIVMMLLKPE